MTKIKQTECIYMKCKNTAKQGGDYCRPHEPKKVGTGKWTKTTYKECHSGNVVVAEPRGIKIYAGGSNRDGGWWRMNPYPDIAIGPESVVKNKGSKAFLPEEGWSMLQPFLEPVSDVIGLDWPDMGVPLAFNKPLPREFWTTLVYHIWKKEIKTVSCQCVGGHGRTGVQVCILLHLLTPEKERTWTDFAGLLDHVHKVYCKNAVENDKQALYAAEMCDLEAGDYTIHSRWGGTALGSTGGGNTWSKGKKWCKHCMQWCQANDIINQECGDCYEERVNGKKEEVETVQVALATLAPVDHDKALTLSHPDDDIVSADEAVAQCGMCNTLFDYTPPYCDECDSADIRSFVDVDDDYWGGQFAGCW